MKDYKDGYSKKDTKDLIHCFNDMACVKADSIIPEDKKDAKLIDTKAYLTKWIGKGYLVSGQKGSGKYDSVNSVTPFLFAVAQGNMDALKFVEEKLRDKGVLEQCQADKVDMFSKTKSNQHALIYAAMRDPIFDDEGIKRGSYLYTTREEFDEAYKKYCKDIAPGNYLKILEHLLNSGYGVFLGDKDDFGKTALMYATEYRDLASRDIDFLDCLIRECVKKCNELGTDGKPKKLKDNDNIINMKDKQGKTALMHLIHYNAEKESDADAKNFLYNALNKMISVGKANINLKDNEGKTAFMLAASAHYEGKCSIELLEVLIDKGANIHEGDNDKKTALILAAEKDAKEASVLELELLSNSFDNEKRKALIEGYFNNEKRKDLIEGYFNNEEGKYLIEAIVKHMLSIENECSLKAVKVILKIIAHSDEYEDRFKYLTKVFRHALKNKCSVEALELLSRYNPDFTAKDEDGTTALMQAIQVSDGSSSIPAIQIILDKCSSPIIDEVDNKQNTALMMAYDCSNYPLVEELVKAGANVDKQYSGGETILMKAINKGGVPFDILQSFIRSSSDLNLEDTSGTTALIRAVKKSNYTVAKELISNGANVNWSNGDEKVAFDYAKEDPIDLNILSLLIEAGTKYDEKTSSRRPYIGEEGKTHILPWALYMNYDDLAKLLIDKGWIKNDVVATRNSEKAWKELKETCDEKLQDALTKLCGKDSRVSDEIKRLAEKIKNPGYETKSKKVLKYMIDTNFDKDTIIKLIKQIEVKDIDAESKKWANAPENLANALAKALNAKTSAVQDLQNETPADTGSVDEVVDNVVKLAGDSSDEDGGD